MNLYLHAGAHKTASSLLQSALRENKEFLFDEGLKVVLRKDIINSDFQKALIKIKEGAPSENDLTLGRSSLKNMLPKRANLDCLMTNEDLFCNLKLQDFYVNIKDQVKYISDSVPKGTKVKFVLYVRSQADYLESVYMQYIHLGRSLSFESYLGDEIPLFLSWLRVAEEVSEAIGEDNVILKPFETIKQVGSRDFYHDFLREVGVGDVERVFFEESLSTQRGANRSYSALGMEIAKKVNPLLSKKEERDKLRSFLQSNFSTATHKKASFLSDTQRNEIFEIYKNENREMFRKYMSRFDGEVLGYF